MIPESKSTPSSDFIIGPIQFSHHVQDIAIQEQKTVQPLPVTRTDKTFIIESGTGNQQAVVRLLISGLYEINNKLRKLILLFRSCPIVSVSNELLYKTWGAGINYEGSFLPVTLNELAISTVPDIPEAFFVTLTIARVDISPVSKSGVLLYQQKDISQGGSPFPSDAFYLNKWLDTALDQGLIPALAEEDLDNVYMKWSGRYLNGSSIGQEDVVHETDPVYNVAKNIDLSVSKNTNGVKIQSESAVLRNIFAYNRMQTKGYPFPQHMGVSSKMYSMDLIFDEQNADLAEDTPFKKFCLLKEAADKIIRERSRFARLTGWKINTPVVKLLGTSKIAGIVTELDSGTGTYVPLQISIETTKEPFTKAVRIDLAESNFETIQGSELSLYHDASDYDGVRRVFNTIVGQEQLFRDTYIKDARAFTAQRKSPGAVSALAGYQVFWPIDGDNINFSRLDTFGLLNRETLKAVFISDELDEGGELKILLEKTLPIAAGYRTDTAAPSFVTRVIENYKQFKSLVSGVDRNKEPFIAVAAKIEEYVLKAFTFNLTIAQFNSFAGGIKPFRDIALDPQLANLSFATLNQAAINNVVVGLLISYFGEYRWLLDIGNESGQVVLDLSRQTFTFSPAFLDALFSVIVRRKSPRVDSMRKMYDVEGLHAAYFKLLVSYLRELENNPSLNKVQDEVNTASRRLFSKTTYPDLLLPTYGWLYGDKFTEFAPSYSDIGQINPAVQTSVNGDESKPQDDVCVLENDIVSPTAWFYAPRYKPQLQESIKGSSSAASAIGHTFHLSLPFNTDEIEAIEKELKSMETSNNRDNRTLPTIIKKSFDRMQAADQDAFDQGMRELAYVGKDLYANSITGPKSKLYLLLHSIDNINSSPRLSMPGVVGELFKFAKNANYLRPSDKLPYLETNFQYRPSDRANEQSFLRGTDANTYASLKSSLDQLSDTFEDPIKFFPAVKVYLLEKRGSDLIGDDSFFSVNPIISVNISSDKDDADLAIITIADPLFILQHSFFPQSNVITVKKDNKEPPRKLILNSISNEDSDSFLKRQRIQEGRRIQIRMGYGSVPRNLETVFTGKIVEVQHGDVLTLVCQGWKTELVNSQVSFYNDNVKNWGARDLAVMTMEHANPDGFGDFYPQMTLAYIKRNITSADLQEIIDVVATRQEGLENINGSRGFSEKIGNAIRSFMGMRASGKKNEGLDTRLKNIWVADLPNFNNFAHWRYWTNTMPSQANDSWIVPMKPAWEVLKEASRHAWNTIVQVVPYDGEATLFFGHPDGPYYYTKGRNIGKKARDRYNISTERRKTAIEEIVKGFKSSGFYKTPESNQFPTEKIIKTYINTKSSNTFTISDTDILMLPEEFLNQLRETTPGIADLSAAPLVVIPKPSYTSVTALLEDAEKADSTSASVGRRFLLGGGTNSLGPSEQSLRLFTSSQNAANNLIKVRDAILTSSKPEVALQELQDRFGMATIPIIIEMFYGVPAESVYRFWPSAAADIPMMISGDTNRVFLNSLSQKINIPAESNLELIARVNSFINSYRDVTNSIQTFKGVNLAQVPGLGGSGYGPGFSDLPNLDSIRSSLNTSRSALTREESVTFAKVIELLQELERDFRPFTGSITRQSILYLDPFKINQDDKKSLIETIESIRNEVDGLTSKIQSTVRDSSIMGIDLQGLVDPDLSGQTMLNLKVFVFYLNEYIKDQQQGSAVSNNLKALKETEKDTFPPHVKIFRVHHWIEDDRDIIKNQIVASMKDMWNTVVIEHPAHSEATAAVTDERLLGGDNDFYSGVQWVYYPKSEITGVIGLQFHPGLTLRNKKLRVFSELNCQSNELAAKLACTHLADGLRRMYRGNLLTVGRNIKPHDRIVLDDRYNQMTGPLEVESVVQHWGVDTGWVTDIGPQAVCDANPGAAILETAALEDTFSKVFKAIDYASDALTLLLIIGTFGSGTPLAQGVNFGIRSGIKGLVQGFYTQGLMRTALSRVAALGKTGKLAIEGIAQGGGAYQMLGRVLAANGPLIWGAAKYYGYIAAARQLSHAAYRMSVTTSFVINAQKAEQLPVILSPLYFNAIPFTAGIDTDDPIWAVQFAGSFWSFRELNAGAEKVWEQLFGQDPNEAQYRISK